MTALSEIDIQNAQRKVGRYKEVLSNTLAYRESWNTELRQSIIDNLKNLCQVSGLTQYSVDQVSVISNLEAVSLSFGIGQSGLSESLGGGLRRELVKNNGSLVYQQLFNGKILVLINFPFIEKYGQPQPPKTIAIYRPEELKDPYFLRHFETFISEITQWEDYDDDLPEPNQRIGFKLNFEDAAKK
jgi:hypothetical protein